MALKLCRDCAHYYLHSSVNRTTSAPVTFCRAAKRPCWDMRRPGGWCGASAARFEPKGTAIWLGTTAIWIEPKETPMKFCKNCLYYTRVVVRNMVTSEEEGLSHHCAAAHPTPIDCDRMRNSRCGGDAILYKHNPASFDHADLIPPEQEHAK